MQLLGTDVNGDSCSGETNILVAINKQFDLIIQFYPSLL